MTSRSWPGGFTEHSARTVDGVRVRLWQGSDVSDADVRVSPADAVRAMETFADWYGRYPYPEVDVVTGQYPWGSMEYPTLVAAVPGPGVAVTHELAHQWWYALVGNNQYADPWLDEAFTHCSALRLTGEEVGIDCADPPWQPGDCLTNGLDYYAAHGGSGFVVIYLIGSCMLFDLEQTLGGDRMLAMLRHYAVEQRFGISTPEEFRAAAQAVSPVDLAPFWTKWRAA